ncbi:MAG: AEC family transporter [Faecalibacterium prausnitzii]
MELALITAQQVAVLFLLIGTGMVAVKTGVLKLENKQALSNLLVYIIVPAMVVNSYRMEFSAQILRNLLAAFGMSVLSVLLGTVITLLLTARKTGSRMPIFRFACIFSNAAYMGFPLISALFGVLGFHGTAAQVVALLECCPAAAITSVFAVQFGHDEHFAAGSVVLTTLLSIITLPLCALIITMVM